MYHVLIRKSIHAILTMISAVATGCASPGLCTYFWGDQNFQEEKNRQILCLRVNKNETVIREGGLDSMNPLNCVHHTHRPVVHPIILPTPRPFWECYF